MIYCDCENIAFKLYSASQCKGERFQMRLFSRKGRAVKNWHERALMIDLKKTKLTIVNTSKSKQLPPWVYRKFVPQQSAPN
jgi:hypothetical protein